MFSFEAVFGWLLGVGITKLVIEPANFDIVDWIIYIVLGSLVSGFVFGNL